MNMNMELKALFDGRKSFYKKATVEVVGNNRTLISYDTEICTIYGNNEIELLCAVDNLTQTTTRHLREFLKQNGFTEIANLSKSKLIKELQN